MEIIAKHLQIKDKPLELKPTSQCCFTGAYLTKGYLKKEVIAKTFNDNEYLKFNTDFVSESYAKLFNGTFTHKGKEFNLRASRFYSNETELVRLDTIPETLDYILDKTKKVPFVLALSEGFKKHLSFKCKENYNPIIFTAQSDVLGRVDINLKRVDEYLKIVQQWYSFSTQKTGDTDPTWFTKDEIRTGIIKNTKKIEAYGFEKFFNQNKVLSKYRGTLEFQVIINFLYKTKQ